MRLLLLEDEFNLGMTLVDKLEAEGYEVLWTKTLREANQKLDLVSPLFRIDLAILDVSLPDGSGFDFASALRKKSPETAFLFLTASHHPEQRMKGFELGAEDYIPKPFHWKELSLRVKNSLKRLDAVRRSTFSSSVQLGKAKINFLQFEVKVKGEAQSRSLTHKEIVLLKLFLERRGQVISRDEILDAAWSPDEFPTPRTVDNFILRLRRCIEEDPDQPQLIRSIRGVGYMLTGGGHSAGS